MAIRTYSELMSIPDFLGRYKYLKLDGVAFDKTFGDNRYLCQKFYMSYEWRKFRRDIILRDNGCDLGIEGRPILTKILIHHLNPITVDDILKRSARLMDPENVITTQKVTHDAIHYGSEELLFLDPIVRKPNDMAPWK